MLARSRTFKPLGASDGTGTEADLGLLQRRVAAARREMRRRDETGSGRGSPEAITQIRRRSPSGFAGPAPAGLRATVEPLE